jgi:hypothetical protein
LQDSAGDAGETNESETNEKQGSKVSRGIEKAGGTT